MSGWLRQPHRRSPSAGDDEQSDWFVEGDCGVATGMAGLLPGWDSDHQLSLDGSRRPPTFLHPARPPRRGTATTTALFLLRVLLSVKHDLL